MSTMNCFAVLTLFVVCFSVVFCKNVENLRTKRTPSATGFQSNCDNVKAFFQMKNISMATIDSYQGSVCGGDCCDVKTEALLRKQGQRDFAALLRHTSRSLQGLLTSTGNILQNHVSELAHQSENKTLLLFSQVYRGMAVLSREPISSLYKDIRQYIHVNTTGGKFATTSPDIKASVTQFFTDLFPLVYHHSANTADKDFTLNYKACLKNSIEAILPFGEVPHQISHTLSKSLEATRLLLQAFSVGTEVLNTTDTLLIDEPGSINSDCHDALLKMTYCPKCKGLVKNAKPCAGYCLNVLRGCITKYVAELDLPWNGYVEGIESLVNAIKKNNHDAEVNVDTVIRELDTRISSAIMYSMEKGKDIDVKVKQNCGPAKFSEKEDPLIVESSTIPSTTSNGKTRQSNPRPTNQRLFSPFPETQLVHFLTSIAKTKGFYGNLADTLCNDESFTEPKNERCWNGERIADYTKTVVDVGLDAQKYNPEVKPLTNTQYVDPRIADLVDKLRHVHHVIKSLGTPYPEDYMQRDGTDGSGSGSGPDFEDEDEDMRGSGSGGGPSEDPKRENVDDKISTKPSYNEPTKTVHTAGCSMNTSSASIFIPLIFTIFTLLLSKHY